MSIRFGVFFQKPENSRLGPFCAPRVLAVDVEAHSFTLLPLLLFFVLVSNRKVATITRQYVNGLVAPGALVSGGGAGGGGETNQNLQSTTSAAATVAAAAATAAVVAEAERPESVRAAQDASVDGGGGGGS